MRKGTFPKNLKNAGVTPVFKKANPLLAKNYRPVSVLPTLSKTFKRIMRKQIIDYTNQYFLPCCADTEKALIHKRFWFEKWNLLLDKREYVGAILTDLSKVLDTISY